VGRQIADDDRRVDQFSRHREDAGDAPPRDDDPLHRSVCARLPTERGEVCGEGSGEASRATCRARPAHIMPQKEEIEGGERTPRFPRGYVGVHRRSVQPRAAVIAPQSLGRKRRGGEQCHPHKFQRTVDADPRQEAQGTRERGEAAEQRPPDRVALFQIGSDEGPPCLPVAGRQAVEIVHGLVEVAVERGGAAIEEGMGHRDRRVDPAQPVPGERHPSEDRRRGPGGIDGRKGVVPEAGECQLLGSDRTAEARLRFEDEDGSTVLREGNRGG